MAGKGLEGPFFSRSDAVGAVEINYAGREQPDIHEEDSPGRQGIRYARGKPRVTNACQALLTPRARPGSPTSSRAQNGSCTRTAGQREPISRTAHYSCRSMWTVQPPGQHPVSGPHQDTHQYLQGEERLERPSMFTPTPSDEAAGATTVLKETRAAQRPALDRNPQRLSLPGPALSVRSFSISSPRPRRRPSRSSYRGRHPAAPTGDRSDATPKPSRTFSRRAVMLPMNPCARLAQEGRLLAAASLFFLSPVPAPPRTPPSAPGAGGNPVRRKGSRSWPRREGWACTRAEHLTRRGRHDGDAPVSAAQACLGAWKTDALCSAESGRDSQA